ncbi:MAG: molecular chaperone [Anaerosolibacter sp.]|uniref:polyphosphate polymerase domain-containing protein n=1 Tax=Anaerosolibacter sp. TaxID=1872527 RepID=UPI00262E7D8F|nr:polyphosphate polymerase domain-containing protein [Anaerosolibacter sp.]MDF2545120.1 molecular chaperone [Anaerosolibacter sp.]
MAIEVFSRHESKFLLNKDTYEKIQDRLLDYMEPDKNNLSNGFYTISNIYLDTRDHHLIRTSLSKPKYKEKLRIRAYGVPQNDEKVYLEIKKKVCGLVNKRRTTLKLDEAYDFVSSGIKPVYREYMNRQVINEIAYMLTIYDLEPKLYLAYDRKGLFARENKDLRVTLDTNIRTRRYDLRLENGDHGEPLLTKDQWLMEIKAENSIPLWLSKLLSEYKFYKTSFSKYGLEHQKMILKNQKLKGERKPYSKQYSIQHQLMPQYL